MSGQGNRLITGLRFNLGSPAGYQFYTSYRTSSDLHYAVDTDAINDFYPGGSAVTVNIPKIQTTPLGEQYVIKASTAGSLTLVPPMIAEGTVPLWNYTPMPSALTGEGGLNSLMQTRLFKVKNAWQIDGIPQHVYYRCDNYTPDVLPNTPEELKPTFSIFQSWVQAQGQVHGCGAIVPIDYSYSTDFQYDAPLIKLDKKKRLDYFVPDTDWFGRGTVQFVAPPETHPEYGFRQFYILSDTEGAWHCYPISGFEVGTLEYQAQYLAYGSTGYKANINSTYVQKKKPIYPSWVAEGVSWRNLHRDDPDRLILEPRYTWSFNQNGTRAISVVMERKPSECKFTEIDYAPDGLGMAVYNAMYGLYISQFSTPAFNPINSPHLPTELTIDEILIDKSENLGKSSDPQSVQVDRRGWLELEFTIELTGPNLEDFTFTVGMLHSYSPDDLLALNQGVLVDVAYAMPMQWDIASFGVRSLTESTFTVQTNDVLSVWLELYRHQEQIDLIGAYDGEVSMNEPSKAKAFFYKGATPDNLSSLFVLSLYQAHGDGYTFTIPPALPPEPHLFVRQTCQSFTSRYPWEPLEGESPELYTYDGKITHLDLRSLSFYYTVRLLEQNHDEAAHDATGGVYIRNKAKTWCAVCVMGKIVQEEFVGHDDLPVNWIQGWVKEAGLASLDEDEFLTPPDLIGNLRGCGFLAKTEPIEYQIAGYTEDHYPSDPALQEVKFMSKDFYGRINWVNKSYKTLSPVTGPYFYGAELNQTPYIDELPVAPWFMIGPCGHLFNFALYLCLVEQQFSGTSLLEPDPGDGSYTSLDFYGFKPINSIVESDIPDFIEFFYTLLDNYTMHLTVSDGSTTLDGDRVLGLLYEENPFVKSCPDLSLVDFIAASKNYIWKIIQSTQKYSILYTTPANLNAISNVWRFYAGISRINYYLGTGPFHGLTTFVNHFVFPRGGGAVKYENQNRLIDPVDNLTTREQFRKQKIVKNFELGNMYYNTAIVRHFTPSPMHAKDAIQVTPEGHYSFARRDLFEINKEYCTQDVKYYNDKAREDYLDFYSVFDLSDGAMPVILRYEPIPAQGLTIADMDWKLLEGIHWFYGTVKTTHLATYNLAYSRETDTAVRKPYLYSEEEYEDWYSKDLFKPDFKFLTYNNYLWIYPFDHENGQPFAAIYRSLNSTHNSSTLLYPKFDGRNKRSSIRLSPLFFS